MIALLFRGLPRSLCLLAMTIHTLPRTRKACLQGEQNHAVFAKTARNGGQNDGKRILFAFASSW